MKKLLFIFLLAIACMGCERRSPAYTSSQDAIDGVHYINPMLTYRIENINGHQYIVFNCPYSIAVVHSESCPCKQKKK